MVAELEHEWCGAQLHIWGKENLTDAVWHSPTNAADRFFKVSVEMP